MRIRVEPEDGTDLDRLITALLNATGVVHRAIAATERRSATDGSEIVSRVAERLRNSLALATEVLAEATLLAAEDLGLSGAFYEP